jgi:hypothetical protein
MKSKMRPVFVLAGLLALALIFWTVLGYLLGLPSFRLVFPLSIGGIVLFFVTGYLKNREERRKFEEYLESRKRDPEVQEKIRNGELESGDKIGYAKSWGHYRDRNTGVNWTGASVHGAVPHRRPRRNFLPGFRK